MEIIETLKSAGIIPVIVIEDEAKAVPLANALVAGGLPVLEVTFRTKAAAGAIAKIKAEVPGAIVGAGTLLTKEQVKAAKEAGAVFGVAPGFDPVVVSYAQEIGLPMVPGIATASELSQALTAGVPMVKFFLQLLALFAAEPKSINLTHIAGGGEGVNALLFHPSQQFTEFFVAEQNFEFDALFPAIAADNLI